MILSNTKINILDIILSFGNTNKIFFSIFETKYIRFEKYFFKSHFIKRIKLQLTWRFEIPKASENLGHHN